ncbi:MAG TPA: hypothetical protein VF648_05845 [Pyrinomonadaceae bacterium]|jgi:hypothetical protein
MLRGERFAQIEGQAAYSDRRKQLGLPPADFIGLKWLFIVKINAYLKQVIEVAETAGLNRLITRFTKPSVAE